MLRDALLDAWALVLPVDCAGCGAHDRSLCDRCVAALDAPPSTHRLADGTRVVSALDYTGVVREAILSLKEHGRTDVARRLAAPLGRAVAEALRRAEIDRRSGGGRAVEALVVPSSRAAYRRRGYDPVALLMRRAGVAPSRVLRVGRSTASQKTLGAAERAANLRGAFAARGPLGGRRFLLVDDILTTGATLDEAARALAEAGGEVVGAATLAFTPRLFALRDNASGGDYGGAKGAR